MPPRFDYGKTAPGAYKAMESLERYLHTCGLEQSLIHLIKLRVSQVNGCAYCLDMHWKDLRAIGETEQRLYSLDAWEECPYYSDRERAALLWAEAVTRVADGHAPDSVYESVRLALHREAAGRFDARDRHDQRVESAVNRQSRDSGHLSGGGHGVVVAQ
jgi:AhpD family alkylhydroperoxidase